MGERSGTRGGAREIDHSPRRDGQGERRWPPVLAIVVAGTLYALLPDGLLLGPRLLIPVLEAVLLVAVVATNPRRITRETRLSRYASLALTAVVLLTNLVAEGLLVHDLVTLPMTVVALFYNARIHPGYGVGWRARFQLAWQMYWNCVAIETATSFKAHLAMAAKLLEIPPDREGAVVECGCFQGGSATNLSLACRLVGRDLILYDSFEGLPGAEPGRRLPPSPSSACSSFCRST